MGLPAVPASAPAPVPAALGPIGSAVDTVIDDPAPAETAKRVILYLVTLVV